MAATIKPARRPPAGEASVRVIDAKDWRAGITVTFSIRSGEGTYRSNASYERVGIATLGNWVLAIGGNSLCIGTRIKCNPLVFVALGTAQSDRDVR